MLADQKPDPDSHRTLRPVVDPDTAWSVIALVNLAKVTHTNFRRANYLLYFLITPWCFRVADREAVTHHQAIT